MTMVDMTPAEAAELAALTRFQAARDRFIVEKDEALSDPTTLLDQGLDSAALLGRGEDAVRQVRADYAAGVIQHNTWATIVPAVDQFEQLLGMARTAVQMQMWAHAQARRAQAGGS